MCYFELTGCRACGLFVSAWQIGPQGLGSWQFHIPLASKIFAVVWPGFIIGILTIQVIKSSTALYFTASNITSRFTLPQEQLMANENPVFISLLVGSALLALILYKYMKTRRILTGNEHRGGWWASKDSRSNNSGTVESGVTITESQRSIYDRALVTRFTIGFVILA